ncbi:unnamed protein product [Phaedon cochleariae]|uniref:Uncharacterized protein n=1 Tax=Phaedon cochleariae TaxID=80249 RepID=A0A9N9X2V8_PHACE|nr:unnamed protein product [Phaedon cochleariae]
MKDYVVELTDVYDIFRKACITTEELCDNNQYSCEPFLSFNDASREVSFEKLPMIMILQLGRFSTTTSGTQKVNTYLPTPLYRFALFLCKMLQDG